MKQSTWLILFVIGLILSIEVGACVAALWLFNYATYVLFTMFGLFRTVLKNHKSKPIR